MAHLLNAAKEGEMTAEEKAVMAQLDELNAKFDAAMDDDFNTADAVSAVFEIVKLANTSMSTESTKEAIQAMYDRITLLCGILGLKVEKEEELLDEEIEQLIADRQAARKNRDFAKADEIRNLLLEKGIVLEDTREGVRWKRA